MLTRIGLKNFKLHLDTTIEAAPVTVFIGPNSSGKSSIFQSLLLWRQAAARNSVSLCSPPQRQILAEGQPYLFPEDQLVDVGEFDQAVKRREREIAFTLSGQLPPERNIQYGPGPIAATLETRFRENRLAFHRGKIDIQVEPLNIRTGVSWEWVSLRQPGQFSIQLQGDTILMRPTQTAALLELVNVQQVSFDYERSLPLQELAQRITNAPSKLLRSVHPVYPLRGFEEAGYPFVRSSADTLDRMALQDRTTALVSILAFNRDIERQLSDWLEGLVGIKIETKLLTNTRATILCSLAAADSRASLFSNEGTGASQLPFILVPIGLTPKGETVLLSEPEAHLHPKMQVEISTLFAHLAKKEGRQFFIETHSEHILHGLLHSIAKGTLRQSDMAIYYFENKEGTSVATRLHVDEKGGVDGGLPGFFDQSLGELSDYLEALKSK